MKAIKNMKIKSLVLACLLMSISSTISSQTRQYIDVWGGVGYSSLYHGIDNSKVSGGIGGELGVGYELNINNLLLIGGAEFQYLTSATTLGGYQEGRNYLYVPENHEMTYWYTFQEYKEKHTVGLINIPIQIGYRFSRYYFLAGAKIGFGLIGNYKTNSTLDITIEDPQFIDYIENVGHGTGQYPFAENGKLDLGLNIAPTLEFGIYLDEWLGTTRRGRRVGPSYRVSIFADYGLTNLNKGNTDNAILTEAKDDPADVSVNSLLSSKLAKDKRFGNLLVGLKFAVLFPLPEKTPPPPSKADFYAQIIDSETKEPIQADVIMNMTTGKKDKIFDQQTDHNGVVSHPDLRLTRYQLSATADGYANYKKLIRHAKSDTIRIAMTPIPMLYVHVYDSETHENLSAEVTMTNTTAGNPQIFKERTNPVTGMYNYQIRSGRYQISATADGYFYKQETINLVKSDTLHIALQAIPKEQPIVLENLLFEFGTANIIPESEQSLADLAQLLTDNPSLHIEITGHTDNVGTASYNMNLSKERAKAVYTRLIEKGIDASRLRYDGKGDTQPKDTNDTEEGRQINRRVEFRILDIDGN